ncbi:hypothetical protein ACH5RR_041771 [Cinchona calisaya]|uniref:Late blight resistance protein homolog R1A-3 n=1 Tax=Cinchona calisaya TaxID=153742 RepID=A0ABD2Y090_9GENT
MDPIEDGDSDIYLYLNVELKRLRTFVKCTKYLLLEKSEDDNDDDDEIAALNLGSLLCKIKDALIKLIGDFGSITHLENTTLVSITQLENTTLVPVEDTDACCFVLFGEIQKILSKLTWKDKGMIDDMCSRFEENNQVLGQEINRAYITFSDCLPKLTSPMRDVNGLMELIHTVLDNLTAILNCCDADDVAKFKMEVRLQNLKVKLRSLKSFISFAKFRDVEHSQLENLLIHAEIFTLKAAHFLYMLWDHLMGEIKDDYGTDGESLDEAYKDREDDDGTDGDSEDGAYKDHEDDNGTDGDFEDEAYKDHEDDDATAGDSEEEAYNDREDEEADGDSEDEAVEDDILIKRDEMLQKIMFVDPFAPEIHIQALQALKASGSTHSLEMKNKEMARDFVHSLSDTLWIVFANSSNTSFLVSVADQMQILYDGLLFLRAILTNQQGTFDELREEMKDFVGDLVNKAGTVVCLLCVNGVKDGFAKETNDAVCDFLEKIHHIKAEIGNKYPVTSTPNFPKTNQLGFIDVLLENLKELTNCKLNSITLVQDQIQVFEKGLVFLRSFLHKFVDQHEELQSLRSRIMEVADKAEFVIDSLMVGNIECSSFLFETITEEIKHIKIEAMEIDESKKYNTAEVQKFTKPSILVPSQGSTSTMDEGVLKVDEETTAIIDRLTRGSMQLGVVTIVGMAGLGKTTLAKIVYNDPSIMYHFHIRSWCCVSQLYSKKDLLLQILDCITGKHCNTNLKEMNEDDLDMKLYRHLKGNRYLIVLDDLWGTEAWNVLKNSFPEDTNASRVLVTSRLQDLASEIKSNCIPHTLRLLTNDESWELLKMKLFVPPAMHVLGKEIARNCKGLPLTIVIVAGILSTLEQDGWEEVLRSLSSESVSFTEQWRYTLELSYKNLPDHLKSCLLYFGLFPEDELFSTDRLIWLWIADGFVRKTEVKALEEVAEDYMKDLINRSLVMVEKRRSSGSVKFCKIHDVIHEFSVAKGREENFLQLLRGGNDLFTIHEASKARRLCIYSKGKDFEEEKIFCPRVRSLICFGPDCNLMLYPSSLLEVFRIFRLLRVLDMYQIDLGDCFPTVIELLILLRFLSLTVSVDYIPPSIANLSYLETFLLRESSDHGTTSLLPDTIWKMKNLRNLYSEYNLILPWSRNLENSCGLCHLQSISTVELRCKNMEKITRLLPNVRKLKCRLSDSSGDMSAGGKCDRIFALDSLTKLESLCIDTYSVLGEFHIAFPMNLKKLSLSYLRWQWSDISSIEKLPNLEVLKIKLNSFEGKVWDMEGVEFPKLKYLGLEYLDIVNWRGDGEHFPCLKKLVLKQLEELEEVPSCLSCISTLEMIEVWWCTESIVDQVKKIEVEQNDLGNEGIKIVIRKW